MLVLTKQVFCGIVLLVLCTCIVYNAWVIRMKSPQTHFTSQNYHIEYEQSIESNAGYDFFNEKQFVFDKRFKNPCWYDKGKLTCLPYFFIVGFRKSGTTQLWSHLARHPDVVYNEHKENNLFGYHQLDEFRNNNSERIDRYVRAFAVTTQRLAKKSRTGYTKYVFGDGSTSTMYMNKNWTRYPGNEGLREPKYLSLDYVHHLLPDTKVLIVFRDPVDRLYSEYYFVYGSLNGRNRLSPESFDKEVRDRVDIYSNCFKYGTVRECVYKSWEKRTKTERREFKEVRLHLGIYYVYMEDLIRIYGRKQILPLRMNELDQPKTLNKVFAFLNISYVPEAKLRKDLSNMNSQNARLPKFSQKGPMLAVTRRLLNDFYRPFNERMARLMNDDYFLFGYGNQSTFT